MTERKPTNEDSQEVDIEIDDAQWDHIRALVLMGDERAIEPLLDIYRNNTSNEPLRQTARLALGQLEGRAVLPLIQKLEDETEEPYVRAWIAEALGSIGEKRAIKPLIKALRDKSSYVRERAADALGRFATAEPVNALTDALDDEDVLVTCAALWSLGQIGSTGAVQHIVPYVTHKDEAVRENAAYALAQLRNRRVTRA